MNMQQRQKYEDDYTVYPTRYLILSIYYLSSILNGVVLYKYFAITPHLVLWTGFPQATINFLFVVCIICYIPGLLVALYIIEVYGITKALKYVSSLQFASCMLCCSAILFFTDTAERSYFAFGILVVSQIFSAFCQPAINTLSHQISSRHFSEVSVNTYLIISPLMWFFGVALGQLTTGIFINDDLDFRFLQSIFLRITFVHCLVSCVLVVSAFFLHIEFPPSPPSYMEEQRWLANALYRKMLMSGKVHPHNHFFSDAVGYIPTSSSGLESQLASSRLPDDGGVVDLSDRRMTPMTDVVIPKASFSNNSSFFNSSSNLPYLDEGDEFDLNASGSYNNGQYTNNIVMNNSNSSTSASTTGPFSPSSRASSVGVGSRKDSGSHKSSNKHSYDSGVGVGSIQTGSEQLTVGSTNSSMPRSLTESNVSETVQPGSGILLQNNLESHSNLDNSDSYEYANSEYVNYPYDSDLYGSNAGYIDSSLFFLDGSILVDPNNNSTPNIFRTLWRDTVALLKISKFRVILFGFSIGYATIHAFFILLQGILSPCHATSLSKLLSPSFLLFSMTIAGLFGSFISGIALRWMSRSTIIKTIFISSVVSTFVLLATLRDYNYDIDSDLMFLFFALKQIHPVIAFVFFGATAISIIPMSLQCAISSASSSPISPSLVVTILYTCTQITLLLFTFIFGEFLSPSLSYDCDFIPFTSFGITLLIMLILATFVITLFKETNTELPLYEDDDEPLIEDNFTNDTYIVDNCGFVDGGMNLNIQPVTTYIDEEEEANKLTEEQIESLELPVYDESSGFVEESVDL